MKLGPFVISFDRKGVILDLFFLSGLNLFFLSGLIRFFCEKHDHRHMFDIPRRYSPPNCGELIF
jgi:hypothetical protein